MWTPRLALAAAVLFIAACAPIPTGPSVAVRTGAGKTADEFAADDRTCRAAAAQEIQTKGGNVPAQRRYDMAYAQCMYAKGHQIPLPGRAPADTSVSSPGTPTAAPAQWPPTRAQVECELSGGVWRAALDFCEFPSPDLPLRRWR